MASWGWPTYVGVGLDELARLSGGNRSHPTTDRKPSGTDDAQDGSDSMAPVPSSEAASTLPEEGDPCPGVASPNTDVQHELDWIDKQILWAADGPLTVAEHEPPMLETRHAYIDRLTRERARLEKLL